MQNQENEFGGRGMTLSILTPDGAPIRLRCDSAHITIRDDLHGRGGGAYGIRCGHARAILALESGPLTARLGDQTVLRGRCGKGFARVDGQSIAIVTESVVLDEES